ncbi:MAG: 23S rRNA (guanosine2251-2'-O)-methyltransferase [Pseudohongiellaceae bacterium]|jgi:23S rRNA (guanosine2251-2'-O)-methyltransferase
MNLRLTNPHSVLAALATRPKDVLSMSVPSHGAGEAWQKAAIEAQENGIRVRQLAPIEDSDDDEGPGRKGDRRSGGSRGGRGDGRSEGGRHGGGQGQRGGNRGGQNRGGPRGGRGGGPKSGRSGGAEAEVRPREGIEVHELFAGGAKLEGGKGLWLAIDQVQDPRNLGAIFRSASFFGVAGVLLTRDRAAPLSSVAYDTASGGLEHVPFAWASNLSRDFAAARDEGLWILGAAGEADDDVSTIDRERPWLLVLGNEEKGLRRLTREGCDQLCRLSPIGVVDSLNVSVAAAVFMAGMRQGR